MELQSPPSNPPLETPQNLLAKKSPVSLSPEKRQKSLQEIFKFYTKQRAQAAVKKTFEAVIELENILSLGPFLKFLKDFEVPIDQKVIFIINFCTSELKNS